MGQTASLPHTCSDPCPCGARQRRPTHAFAGGRLLLVSLPPSAPTAVPSETKRSAPAPCSWGGRASPWGRRHWKPALPAGAWGLGRRCLPLRGKVRAAPRHESPPGFFYSICPFPPLAALSSSRPAKQSAHRGRTAPSAVYYPRRPQKQPARVGTRTVKECRNRFPPHF